MNNQVLINWNSPVKNGNTLLGFNIYRLGNTTPLNTLIVTDSTYQSSIPGDKDTYTFKVVAKYQQGESDPVICNFINHETPSIKDSMILVSLYDQCNGPNWTRHSNWLSGPLSTWEGVVTKNGRVTILQQGSNTELPYANLIGNLPSGFSDLSELTNLDLSNNKLKGNLPEDWSKLVNLKELALWGNQFSGSLPSSWSNLVNLENLLLGNNQISGILPESWSSMVNLKTLYLKFNQLYGSLPDSWSKLVKLERIGLESNFLNSKLPESWSTLVNLNVLSLSDNKFEGPLPLSWSNLENLEYLFLGNNQLSGSLPESWSKYKNLKYLLLYENRLTDTLPESWSSLSQLVHLQIYSNRFTGSLPASWSSMTNLKQFSVWGNQLTGMVPPSWVNLSNLEGLIINDNQLCDLPDLSSFMNLQGLDIRNNLLDFGDIEPNLNVTKSLFRYAPQYFVGTPAIISKNQGEEFKISVSVGGKNNTYQWFKEGLQISGAAQPEYIIPSIKLSDAGIYTCQITNTVATQLTLQSQPITLQVSNITVNNELAFSDFKVYPNPTTGVIIIEGLSTNQKNDIILQSVDGKLIKKKTSYSANESIDISNQVPGTYLLLIDNQVFKIQKK